MYLLFGNLEHFLKKKIIFRVVLGSETFLLCENSADMPREKNLRGLLRSAVDRAVSRDSIVIVDSLNNIKVLTKIDIKFWILLCQNISLFCIFFPF